MSYPDPMDVHPKHVFIGGILTLLLFIMVASGISLMIKVSNKQGTVVEKYHREAFIEHIPLYTYGKYRYGPLDVHRPELWIIRVYNGFTTVDVHVDQEMYESIHVGDDFPASIQPQDQSVGQAFGACTYPL